MPASPRSLLIEPSGDTTGAADLLAFRKALASTGIADLDAGDFWINSDVGIGSFQALRHSGPPGRARVHQVAEAANAVTIGAADGTIIRPLISGIEFLGPSSGSGSGITGGGDGNVIVGLTVRDVIASDFGGSGVALSAVITSAFDGVNCSSNGGAGIYLSGTSSASTPTSCTLRNCYTNSNKSWGTYVQDCNYTALYGCASDSNEIAYEIAGGYGVSLTSCGAEANLGVNFKVNGGTGHNLTSCLSVQNADIAFWATGGASCSFISCAEMGPAASATASFRSDPGCRTTFIQPDYVTPPAFRGKCQVTG